MAKQTWWGMTLLVLAAIGAINWGLVELGWNAVDSLIGSWSTIFADVVYWIIAVSGVYALWKVFSK
jgi:uncharacterized membrane protein YuzA (DUF378 family)